MVNQAALSQINANMEDASNAYNSGLMEDKGSMAAVDFSLSSIASSLLALTGILYRNYIGEVPETEQEPT